MATSALAPSNYDKIKAYLKSDEIRAQFAEVIGSHNAAAYISSVMIAVSSNDKLMQATPRSIIVSAMRAATLRLSCDPALGQAYLVPFNNKVRGSNGQPDRWETNAIFVIGYRGMVNLAERTGKYRYLHCGPVYEGQEVEEDQMRGIHKITGLRASRVAIGYMLYFQLVTGFEKTYYMPVEEIQGHAARYSKDYTNPTGRWKTDFDEMAKKTVLKRGLSKWGYFDPSDMMVMNAVDEDVIDLDRVSFPEPKPRPEAAILSELGFDAEEAEYREEAPEPAPQPPAQAPAQPVLRYQPEQLRARLAEIAATKTGSYNDKTRAASRGTIVAVLEAALSMTTNPKESRHQLAVYLIGAPSLSDATDAQLMALYDWLKPTKDTGGEWRADDMASRETLAAFNACQPKQDSLL